MMTQQKAPKLPQRAYIKITNLQYNVVRIRKSKYIMSQTSVPLNEKKKNKTWLHYTKNHSQTDPKSDK